MMDAYENIEDYVAGRLTAEAREAFEQAMATDAALQDAVECWPAVQAISGQLLDLDMAATVRKLQAAESSKKASPMRWLWLAIAGLLLAGLAYGYLQWQKGHVEKQQGEVLRAGIIVEPVDESATKSIDTVGMDFFEKGKYFYGLNSFEEAEKWLERFISVEKDKKMLSKGHNWLGAAHYYQNEIPEARAAWQKSDEGGAKENLKMIK